MSEEVLGSCADVLATINHRIVQLRDACVSGRSIRREIIDTERWMRDRYDREEYAAIRDVIEPFRFRAAVRASVSFHQHWIHYTGWTNQDLIDLWPYAEIKTESDPCRRDAVMARWREAGGIVCGCQRMIAAKNCGVWSEFSLFDLPYPPFDGYLDVAVIDISRKDACSLKLMRPNKRINPPPMEPPPAPLKIDSDVVTLITETNRATPGRLSSL